jgi:hypothetical protein
MKKLINTIVILGILLLVGCGTTNTTKTTFYNADGTINRIVEETAENSDFSTFIASGNGNATDLRGDITKFSIGWNGYGLNWLSISGGRTKAPVNDKSNSAEALSQIAEVIKANKTTLQASEDLKVNK